MAVYNLLGTALCSSSVGCESYLPQTMGPRQCLADLLPGRVPAPGMMPASPQGCCHHLAQGLGVAPQQQHPWQSGDGVAQKESYSLTAMY